MSTLGHSSITQIAAPAEQPVALSPALHSGSRAWLSVSALLAVDLAALALAAGVSALAWHRHGTPLSQDIYINLWPVLLLFPVAYAGSGLYPGFGRNPAEELRRLSAASSLVYAALAVTIFLLKDATTFSRGVFLAAWTLTLLCVPLGRWFVVSVCSGKPWWGYPVIIVGTRREGVRIAEALGSQPELGLRPAATVDDPDLAAPLARKLHVRHVILGMADIPRQTVLDIFSQYTDLFTDVILIPDLAGFSSLWVEARDLNGLLGLEVHQRLLVKRSRLIKRALDICLIAVASPVIVPLIAVLGVLIKLRSAGTRLLRTTAIRPPGRAVHRVEIPHDGQQRE